MAKLRLDFWNKDFYTKTAFGRTLAGHNKTGQTLGVIGGTLLSAVPFIGKPLNLIKGTVTELEDAQNILSSKGVDVSHLDTNDMDALMKQMNLSDKTIATIKFALIAGVLLFGLAQQMGFLH